MLIIPIYILIFLIIVTASLIPQNAKAQSTSSGDVRQGFGTTISNNVLRVDSSIMMSVTRATASIAILVASISAKADTGVSYSKSAEDARFQPVGTYATTAQNALKVNISDTGAELLPYRNAINANTILSNTKLNTNDTASLSNRINLKLNSADTAAAFTPYRNAINSNAASILTKFTTPSGSTAQYVRGDGTLATLPAQVDTTSLSNRINLKGIGTVTSISTTSPISGGTITGTGTISIANSKADNATKGAAAFDSIYTKDDGNGIIRFSPTYGSGTVSANAVTINEPKGKISLAAPGLLANTNLSITFTNSLITTTSIINVGINGGGGALTLGLNCYIKSQTNGSCVINLLNLSLLSTFNSAITIDFFIVN